jgi:hypothetical protein
MRLSLRATAGAAVAVAAVALVAAPAPALMIAMRSPAQRAITADVVVVGKVTAIEKDLVDAPSPYAGAKDTQKYKIAVVKIGTGLVGADKMTEIKVGVFQPPKPDPNVKPPVGGGPVSPVVRPPRGPAAAVELKEGQELLLFVSKHPSADFYIFTGMSPPVDLKDEQGKKDLEAVKKVTAVLTDPMKGLKSDKAEVRAETAAVVITKYRSYPDFGGEVDQVAVPADESKLLLKGLTDADWSNQGLRPGVGNTPNALQAFYSLGLTPKDGWVPPAIAPQPPGTPPIDFAAVQKDAFIKWLDGPGKNYQIKKIVPKKK